MKYILLFVLSAFILSCDKEENDPPPTNAELLTKSEWKYESGGVDQDKNGTIDLSFAATGLLQPCILDNTVSFSVGGGGTTSEGATKCDPAAPPLVPFAWSFNSTETEIFISGGLLGLGGQFKVIALTDTRFSVAKDTSVSFSGGIPTPISLIVNQQH